MRSSSGIANLIMRKNARDGVLATSKKSCPMIRTHKFNRDGREFAIGACFTQTPRERFVEIRLSIIVRFVRLRLVLTASCSGSPLCHNRLQLLRKGAHHVSTKLAHSGDEERRRNGARRSVQWLNWRCPVQRGSFIYLITTGKRIKQSTERQNEVGMSASFYTVLLLLVLPELLPVRWNLLIRTLWRLGGQAELESLRHGREYVVERHKSSTHARFLWEYVHIGRKQMAGGRSLPWIQLNHKPLVIGAVKIYIAYECTAALAAYSLLST